MRCGVVAPIRVSYICLMLRILFPCTVFYRYAFSKFAVIFRGEFSERNPRISRIFKRFLLQNRERPTTEDSYSLSAHDRIQDSAGFCRGKSFKVSWDSQRTFTIRITDLLELRPFTLARTCITVKPRDNERSRKERLTLGSHSSGGKCYQVSLPQFRPTTL